MTGAASRMDELNRGNLAAANSNARQFGRAWTKVEQIYRVGVCDF